MNVLIVVSHPDDEVLGMGATGAMLANSGHTVRSCILSGNANARTLRPKDEDLYADINKAQNIVGFKKPILGDFPNIMFNNVDHLALVQFIERAIVESRSEMIFTHHPSDLNNDHRHTSLACQAAARVSQRRNDLPKLCALYYMEVLSSTDWGFSGQETFSPNTYCQIGDDALQKKINAISAYRDVMREFPHPRSKEVITALAVYRGGQSGLNHAEAFQAAFRVMKLE